MSLRKLTSEEIEGILDFIKPQKDIPPKAAMSIVEKNKERFRRQLVGVEIYEQLIPELKERLRKTYISSLMDPGESVGVLAAQSIGEKNTQMSIRGTEPISVKIDGAIVHTTMGSLYEKMSEKLPVVFIDSLPDSSIINPGNVEVLSIAQDEKIYWKKVSEISRHPANGKLVTITTVTGRTVTGTLSHSFLKRQEDFENPVVPVKGSELSVGDRTPVARNPFGVFPTGKMDVIPAVGSTINSVSATLRMHGHSGGDISRELLKNFVELFEEKAATSNCSETIVEKIRFLRRAYESDVIWDQIEKLDVFDSDEYVYDFTVPGTETFILGSGIAVHNTLNTFHRAGQNEKGVTAGVPRFQELLSATKNPKLVSANIFFKGGNNTVRELRATVGNSLAEVTLGKLVKTTEYRVCPEPEEWYGVCKLLHNDKFEQYTDCISYELDKALLFSHRLRIQDVAQSIEGEYDDLACVFCPTTARLDIYADTESIEMPENIPYIDDENYKLIYLEDVVSASVEKLLLAGVPGISGVYFTHNDDEWYVETDGCNFSKILAMDHVDSERTTSNNVWDIYDVLGIEAAKQFLIEEYMDLMGGINICHTKVLVERMTHNGTISSISRYTMRSDECGPLGKASFEESLEHFVRAATFGDKEPTKGASAAIICGKRANMGTGMMNVQIDIQNLPGRVPVMTDVIEKEDEVEKVEAPKVKRAMKNVRNVVAKKEVVGKT